MDELIRWQVVDPNSGAPLDQQCGHVEAIVPIATSTIAGCEDCLREGSEWVHLRECLTCGRIRCCDNSPRQHSTAHWKAGGHPLLRSVEPGESWAWCYPEELFLLPLDD